MTLDKNRRRGSGDFSHASVEQIEAKCEKVLDQLRQLQEEGAIAAVALDQEHTAKLEELSRLHEDYSELNSIVNAKEANEVRELSQVYDAQFSQDMDRLVSDNISIPEAKLKRYWDQLKFRLDPSPLGGVAAVMGFHPSTRLPDLRFVLQLVADAYVVSECDPMVFGLSEILDRLNADTRTGSLARFCCRLRARYTAQYSTEF